ncbi:hypothetical protein AAVH_22732 [Aphelenchoides avenae]|nr:hypothetical protein AAVH_22732 [Aphelenchus avenae]
MAAESALIESLASPEMTTDVHVDVAVKSTEAAAASVDKPPDVVSSPVDASTDGVPSSPSIDAPVIESVPATQIIHPSRDEAPSSDSVMHSSKEAHVGFVLAEPVRQRRLKQAQPTKRPRGRPRKTATPTQPRRNNLSVLSKKPPTTKRQTTPVTSTATAFHPCKRCSDRIAVTYASTPYIADGMILVSFCGECHASALSRSEESREK